MSNGGEITGVPSTGIPDDDDMAAIDAAVYEVAAALNQGLRKKN